MIDILSIHWGFMPGGVATYAHHIENVGSYAPLCMKSICINGPEWPFDEGNATSMNMEIVKIKGRSDFSWISKVRTIVQNYSPDLIMSHGFNGAFVGAVTGNHIPLVSSWHGNYYAGTPMQRIRKPFIDLSIQVLFGHYVKEIVTVSYFSKEALIRHGIDQNKISVIHNGINPDPITTNSRDAVRSQLGIATDNLLAGTACRLVAIKGLECFLEAMAIITQRRRNLRFVIWGDGPQRDLLREKIIRLNIGKYVSLPGYRPDITECLPALDIFIMSSYAEHFSIALLEAMRAGLPIVATRAGGNPEAISDECEAILVPVANAEALAEGIYALADDPARRKQMAQNARERFVSHFTSEKMVDKTAQWFMKCAGRYAGDG